LCWLSPQTGNHKNVILLFKHLDNLPSGKILSETLAFFLKFSKLSLLADVWLVYPTFSYKYYGNQGHATLKANFTFKK
jgi:hypothetical protein